MSAAKLSPNRSELSARGTSEPPCLRVKQNRNPVAFWFFFPGPMGCYMELINLFRRALRMQSSLAQL